MIRKIGGRAHQQVFVHRYVAIDMAMSLSPNFKAVIISIFDKMLTGRTTDAENEINQIRSGTMIVDHIKKNRPDIKIDGLDFI